MDNELQELVASLHRTDAKRRSAAASAKQLGEKPVSLGRRSKGRVVDKGKQKAILAAAILVIAVGVGSLIYSAFFASTDQPATGSSVVSASVGPQGGSDGTSAGGGTTASLNVASSNSKAQPKDFLDRLTKKGVKMVFAPIADLRLPANGQPLKLSCLLRSELDPNTLRNWKAAGMIKSFNIETPFIRRVTIANQEALDNLYDWHVEAVATSLTIANPAGDSQP